jgi:hypothetical protein
VTRVEFRDPRSSESDRRDVSRCQPERLGSLELLAFDEKWLSTAAGHDQNEGILSYRDADSR